MLFFLKQAPDGYHAAARKLPVSQGQGVHAAKLGPLALKRLH